MKYTILTLLYLCFFLNVTACSHQKEQKKEMKASEIYKLIEKGKDVLIIDKIIIDDIDFTKMNNGTEELKNVFTHYISSSIVFKNCQFKGKITTYQLENHILHRTFFMKNLSFIQCIFDNTVDIQQSTIQGIANFSESVFYKNVSLEASYFQSSVFFDKVTCQQEARFQNIVFNQNFGCSESFFYQLVSFQKTVFRGNTMCNSIEFHGNLDMGLTTFYGPFLFNYNQLKLKSNFNKVNCRDKFECLNTKFQQDVTFKEAVFFQKVKWADNINTSIDFSESIFYEQPIGNFQADSTQKVHILFKK